MSPTPDPVLLERDAPLAAVCGLVAALAPGAGHGRCLVLEGEAGIGKTSLLQAARAATASTADWWWGGCDPLLAPPALAPWFDILPLLPPRLADSIRRGAVGADLYTGLLSLLRDATRPVVVVLEDMHWADGASLDLLRYLARRIEGTTALLVVTWRAGDIAADHPLRALTASLPAGTSTQLTLAPLSEAGVATWLRRIGRDADQARRLLQITGGNPFFITHMLDAPRSDGDTLPAAVQAALLARIARLAPPARALLEIVSLSPGPLGLAVLQAVGPAAPGDLDEAIASGLLRFEGSGATELRFVHELARLAVASTLGPRATLLHARLFDALQRHGGASASRLVHHAEHGGQVDAVIALAPDAARAAGRASAHRQAAALYEVVLRHAAHLPPAFEAELAAAHAQACLLINAVDGATKSSRRALALARALGDRVGEGRQLRVLARIEWMRGYPQQAHTAARQAIDALQAADPGGREWAMACLTMGQIHLLDDDPSVALRWVEQALPGLRSANDVESEVYALNTAGPALLALGRYTEGLPLLVQARDKAGAAGLEELAARAWTNLVGAALVQHRLADAESLSEQALAYCQAHDIDVFSLHVQIRHALLRIQQGRWSDAAAALDRLDRWQGLNDLQRDHVHWLRAFLAVRMDDPDAASAAAGWHRLTHARRPQHPRPWFFDLGLMEVEASWLLRDPSRSRELAEQAWSRPSQRRDPWRRAQMAVWLRRLGSPLAGGAADPDWPEPAALSLAGRHAEAAQAWMLLGNPYEQALALADDDAPLGEQALGLLAALGAHAAERRIRDRLRQLGVRAVPRGPYAHARRDPLGLTGRQREVLEALAQGLSNREIARRMNRSERTVEQHVARLIDKLGASDRHDAVRRARENQAPDA